MAFLPTISARATALVVSSALLQIFIFPTGGPISPARCALAWFSLTPLLVALGLPGRDDRPLGLLPSALLGYLCGVLWYLGNCSWIYQTMYLYGGLPRPVAFAILILFSLYLGLYHALFAVLFALVRRRSSGVPGSLLATPFLWVAVELARGRITGFPWDLLGYAQVDNLWLTRLAPFAGVMSLSFVIAAVAAGIAAFFFLRGRARFWLPGTSILLALILELGTPFGRHHFVEAVDRSAVMLQENLAVGQAAKQSEPLAPQQELLAFSQMSLAPHAVVTPQITGTPPAVVIWPEAPSHLQSNDPAFLDALGHLTQSLKAPAIVGSLGVELSPHAERGYFLYDSASLFAADGRYSGRYDKIHLVPWGEYVPFEHVFAFAHKLTEGVGNMDRGSARFVFAANGHHYGVFICYESIFGDEVRHFAANGADVLVNISDDGWYGDTGAPWQHLNMTRMRAIENDRWLLLDTNTGITTAIDPKGHPTAEAPRHVRGAWRFPFAFRNGTTVYTRWGDWFAWLCALISLLLVLTPSSRQSYPR